MDAVKKYANRLSENDTGIRLNNILDTEHGKSLKVVSLFQEISEIDPIGILRCCACTYLSIRLQHAHNLSQSILTSKKCTNNGFPNIM